MNIVIGNDHAGTDYKISIIGFLKSMGLDVINHGTDDTSSVDYPDFVHPVAKTVEAGEATFGILICGSGNGVAMTANKHQGIRAALCWNKEIVALARQHNNANILCIPARYTAMPQALEMVKTFIQTNFEGGRHENRVDKIPLCS